MTVTPDLPFPMRWLALALSTASLVGCVSLSGLGGETRYACQAPEGVTCQSVSGTYANSTGSTAPRAAPPLRDAPGVATLAWQGQTGNRPSAIGVRQSQTPDAAARVPIERTLTIGASAGSAVDTPLRLPPRILRLWIKPWEDAEGDLHDPGHVYVQIDAGRWALEHVQRRGSGPSGPAQPMVPRPPRPAGGTPPSAATATPSAAAAPAR